MRTHDEEEAAALAVRRVVGGTWQLNDTGRESGQVDLLLQLDDGRRIALEVTSEGAARRLGVSYGTLVRTLNGSGRIRSSTSRAIRAAAQNGGRA